MEKIENYCNTFKFGIYLGEEPINERVFSGDDFNQVTMYQIDVRKIIGSIQRKIQSTLSDSNPTNILNGYNVLDYFFKNNKNYGYDTLKIPEEKTLVFNDKTYKGVEVKIGFYLNDNTIFERFVYINRYNPKCRFSYELYETVSNIVSDIKNKIKKDDIKQMWDDFDLINSYNLHISQVRELSKEDRSKLLYRINK
jgi:hypothetical protein